MGFDSDDDDGASTMQASSLPAAALNPAIQRPILRQTTQELAERGLNFASKWLAEPLVSLAPEDDVPVDEPGLRFSTSTPLRGASGAGERGGRADRGGRTTAGREGLPGLGLGASIARQSGYRDSLGSVGEMEGSSPVGRGERMEEDIEEESAPGDREIKERGRRLDVRERDLYSLGLAFFRTHELLRAAHILEGCKGPKARWLWGYSKFLVSPCRVHIDVLYSCIVSGWREERTRSIGRLAVVKGQRRSESFRPRDPQ